MFTILSFSHTKSDEFGRKQTPFSFKASLGHNNKLNGMLIPKLVHHRTQLAKATATHPVEESVHTETGANIAMEHVDETESAAMVPSPFRSFRYLPSEHDAYYHFSRGHDDETGSHTEILMMNKTIADAFLPPIEILMIPWEAAAFDLKGQFDWSLIQMDSFHAFMKKQSKQMSPWLRAQLPVLISLFQKVAGDPSRRKLVIVGPTEQDVQSVIRLGSYFIGVDDAKKLSIWGMEPDATAAEANIIATSSRIGTVPEVEGTEGTYVFNMEEQIVSDIKPTTFAESMAALFLNGNWEKVSSPIRMAIAANVEMESVMRAVKIVSKTGETLPQDEWKQAYEMLRSLINNGKREYVGYLGNQLVDLLKNYEGPMSSGYDRIITLIVETIKKGYYSIAERLLRDWWVEQEAEQEETAFLLKKLATLEKQCCMTYSSEEVKVGLVDNLAEVILSDEKFNAMNMWRGASVLGLDLSIATDRFMQTNKYSVEEELTKALSKKVLEEPEVMDEILQLSRNKELVTQIVRDVLAQSSEYLCDARYDWEWKEYQKLLERIDVVECLVGYSV